MVPSPTQPDTRDISGTDSAVARFDFARVEFEPQGGFGQSLGPFCGGWHIFARPGRLSVYPHF